MLLLWLLFPEQIAMWQTEGLQTEAVCSQPLLCKVHMQNLNDNPQKLTANAKYVLELEFGFGMWDRNPQI